MKKKFTLTTEFINLSQLLKATHITGSGSDAHMLILGKKVKVNGAIEIRKRAKLYKGDVVNVEKIEIELV